MKLRISAAIILMPLAASLAGEPVKPEKLFIPFLQKDSQSNVVVSIADLGEGRPCPAEYTNLLSNTNLFSLEQQRKIRTTFEKYREVTETVGPPGTVLVDSYTTNFTTTFEGNSFTAEQRVAVFNYTNHDAQEIVRIGKSGGLLAEYQASNNDGYYVSFTQTGAGTLMGFGETANNKPHGLFVRFLDLYPQGVAWDYKKAHFERIRLCEYKRYSKGYLFGLFLMWNLQNGNLQIQAEFTQPYDLNRNRRRMPF